MTTSRLHSLDIRLLRAFAVVAEENNISRAAQRLFISQPPLTRHIRHLEAQLGVTLFQRHSKGLILTDAGREVLAIIRPMLALQERTLAALSELAVPVIGMLMTPSQACRHAAAMPRVSLPMTSTIGPSSGMWRMRRQSRKRCHSIRRLRKCFIRGLRAIRNMPSRKSR